MAKLINHTSFREFVGVDKLCKLFGAWALYRVSLERLCSLIQGGFNGILVSIQMILPYYVHYSVKSQLRFLTSTS